jgi:hypothetical protein
LAYRSLLPTSISEISERGPGWWPIGELWKSTGTVRSRRIGVLWFLSVLLSAAFGVTNVTMGWNGIEISVFGVPAAVAIRESERSRRLGLGLGLLVLDLDRFKELNDQYGHEAGDLALARAARRIESALRETDLLFRWGGEEFVRSLLRGEAAGAESDDRGGVGLT